MGYDMQRWNLNCGHHLLRSCVSTVCSSLSWDYQHIFCMLCLNLRWKTVCMWDKTRQAATKVSRPSLRTYCFCGWWVLWCLAACPLYPRVDLRQMFHKCLSGNFQQVSTDSGMWSVSKEWKVQCLNRKISGYSESDKTGMAYFCLRPFWLVYKESLRNWTKQHHVTGRACTAPC